MPNKSNHLSGEKSPYLLQHAANPVNWYPWGEAAMALAKAEEKPILLSIGYSTCHWCHVMAHESFEDQDIAGIINKHFVAVKVDREERPDIDHIYMTAVTAMTGQGGWPLTVFLTPDGEPFYGGTYFPPYPKWGSVGFTDVLNSIAAAWKDDRPSILSSGRSITASLKSAAMQRKTVDSGDQDLNENLLHRAFHQMHDQFDAVNGGFGAAPKFPMGHSLSFLLRYHLLYQEPEALNMTMQTLSAMARGGIWDHLGGGFHRYSTDSYWHVPHFEKMLYDQALLSRCYLEAYQATGLYEYSAIARGVLDYVQEKMTDNQGGFYSAEDADSLEAQSGHLKEGAYYVFTKEEIDRALGDDHAAIFNYYYGVLPQGNAGVDPHGEFKEKNIFYAAHSIEQAAGHFHKHEDEIKGILKEGRDKLLAIRESRHRPHRDEKVLCDWNGLMISSFALAGRILAEPSYIRTASRAADFILDWMMKGSHLYHRWFKGQAGIMATLEDYAFLINGLLELYEACFDVKYLKTAEVLANRMIDDFGDIEGGFFMTALQAESLIIRPKDIYDGALPSGNSVAALGLLRLYAMTENDVYRSQAGALFNCFGFKVSQAPYAYTFFLSALAWQFGSPLQISLQGRQGDEVIDKMLKVLYKSFIPFKTVGFTPLAGRPKAQICRRGSCLLPTESAEDFGNQLHEVLSP